METLQFEGVNAGSEPGPAIVVAVGSENSNLFARGSKINDYETPDFKSS